ncbi:hypothetical protein RKD23_006481 [Streptomyces sp. SAI-170]
MTCRIRAGEVARPPEGGFTPRTARTTALRRTVVLGSSTPADPLLSTGHPGGGRTRRPPGPPRRGGGGLSSVRDLHSQVSEIPNGTGDLCCYSPLARSGGQLDRQASVKTAERPRTRAGTHCSAVKARASRNCWAPQYDHLLLRKGVRHLVRLTAASRAQPSERDGSATRAVRRSPSRTRSARARVGACSSVSPRWCISASASRSSTALAHQRLSGAQSAVGVAVVRGVDPAQQVDRLQVTVDQLALGAGQRGQRRQFGWQHRRLTPRSAGRGSPCGRARCGPPACTPAPPGR